MIKFTEITNNNIFDKDFNEITKNNKLSFSNNAKTAIIYGPNGTGKTSLVKVLSGIENTSVIFEYQKKQHKTPKDFFHIIDDQNSRNIIEGEPNEFFLGDNIRYEYKLRDDIDKSFKTTAKEISDTLKKSFNIKNVTNPLLSVIKDPERLLLIKSFVNQRSKGEDVKSLEKLKKLAICDCEKSELTDEEKAKLQYLQNDYVQGKDSVVLSVEKLAQETIVAITGVSHIEENNEAIKILERFKKDNCIVCDTHIDREKLISQKISNKKSIYAKLDKEQQGVLEKVIKLVSSDDPFKIKSNLINTLSTGDISDLLYLKEEFSKTKMLLETQVLQTISTILSSTDLLQQMSKYEQLLEEKLEIHDEDLSFIVAILNSNMDKQLNLDRDENKNIVVKLENNTFLGKTRNELPLSTGEQNFLSLAFEFMKAHNSNKPIVVIDDPISSFDSIYKNKVIYALLKMLSDKRKVVLTHNTDALRLFNAQNGECYSLYLLNNSYRGNNGFVPVNQKEKKLLINLSCLVKFFRREVFSFIENEKLFLISMIPFMRGYANITQKRKWNDKLTNVMHGSMRETVDILEAYNKVFNIRNNKFSFSKFNTSVPEIFNFKIENLCILNKDNYPLLDKTLRHSFSYLYLRLLTEKTLSEKYNIKGNNKTFGAIINKAFPRNNPKMVENRIFLTSKKTLINEFNHFEGNLSIFQPAIDISDQALAKEREDIIGFLNSI